MIQLSTNPGAAHLSTGPSDCGLRSPDHGPLKNFVIARPACVAWSRAASPRSLSVQARSRRSGQKI